LMQNIAMENNLAETAFVVKNGNCFDIRFFMPHAEINLCGHATLSAAFVLFNLLNFPEKTIHFQSKAGVLEAHLQENNSITLNFPAWETKTVVMDKNLNEIFPNLTILKTVANRDLLLEVASEAEVKNCQPNELLLRNLQQYVCVIITAKSNQTDFVSRVFCPDASPIEDPVTGSAHSSLIPYWAKKLDKNQLSAKQLSAREGILNCTYLQDRVLINGNAVLYLKGQIYV
jgi:PhzF family phenazine biosynthesis protein